MGNTLSKRLSVFYETFKSPYCAMEIFFLAFIHQLDLILENVPTNTLPRLKPQ